MAYKAGRIFKAQEWLSLKISHFDHYRFMVTTNQSIYWYCPAEELIFMEDHI